MYTAIQGFRLIKIGCTVNCTWPWLRNSKIMIFLDNLYWCFSETNLITNVASLFFTAYVTASYNISETLQSICLGNGMFEGFMSIFLCKIHVSSFRVRSRNYGFKKMSCFILIFWCLFYREHFQK